MTTKELIDRGDLPAAIQELNQAVRSRPTDVAARLSLFDVLCASGDFDRAARQVDALETMTSDAAGAFALRVYKQLLDAEKLREQTFAGRALPKFVRTPPPGVETYAVLLSKIAAPIAGIAAEYAAAEDATAERPGQAGDAAFSHIRDADDRVAPVLEAFHGSDYLWLPFEQIGHFTLRAPRTLRDLLWTPAIVKLAGEAPLHVFVPALYANSRMHASADVKLGRVTEWQLVDERIVTGAGGRVFVVGDEERSIHDLGAVTLAGAAEGEA